MPHDVILVDEHDNEIGTGEKLLVHEQGRLHRSFSIFVFNEQGEVLLQQRAKTKYHSGGLWSNTCCSHPKPGEATLDAAHRRLKEEMGFDAELKEVFEFVYKVALDHGLTEYEYDHVCIGTFSGTPAPNPEEVGDYKYMSMEDLKQDISNHPELYTYWLRECFNRVYESFKTL
jgi:isopentenyl-diphosphate Delta-isomerase